VALTDLLLLLITETVKVAVVNLIEAVDQVVTEVEIEMIEVNVPLSKTKKLIKKQFKKKSEKPKQSLQVLAERVRA